MNEQEILKAAKNGTLDARRMCSGGGEGERVSREDCIEIRGRAQDGETIQEIVDETGRGRTTITRHISNECDHDISGWAITKAECEKYRELARGGVVPSTIAEWFDRSVNAVRIHLDGRRDRCRHGMDGSLECKSNGNTSEWVPRE